MWKRSHTAFTPDRPIPTFREDYGQESPCASPPPGRAAGQPVTGGRLAVGAITALVLGLTAACGDDSDPTKSADQEELGEGESLTITTFGEFGYDELIEEWNEENPDLQVEQTKVSLWDDWKNELNTLLQANEGLPDVVAIEGDFMPAIVAAPDRWVDLSSDDVDGRWLEFKSDAATGTGRRAPRLRDRRRPRGHLLPRRPLREGRSADRPRRGGRADDHVG